MVTGFRDQTVDIKGENIGHRKAEDLLDKLAHLKTIIPLVKIFPEPRVRDVGMTGPGRDPLPGVQGTKRQVQIHRLLFELDPFTESDLLLAKKRRTRLKFDAEEQGFT